MKSMHPMSEYTTFQYPQGYGIQNWRAILCTLTQQQAPVHSMRPASKQTRTEPQLKYNILNTIQTGCNY